MTYFSGFNFDNFWDDSEYAKKNYVSDHPSNEMIIKIESDLGYRLPKSYIWLMKRHNGGIPINTCFPTTAPTSWAEDHIAISGIFGIGYERSCSLGGEFGSEFWIEEWDYPNIGVAISDCPSAGHDMIFLDYRECGPNGEPCVVHIDQENDYEMTWLANNFESFIKGLVNDDVYDYSEE
ncbi:SMI1/KNR4 family protein [Bacillus sp. WMMC1349]|uniref:SMI1/KNR4 family protein n=1 Tax=Bacillus sp. WMMC1349 TaxID=2736254 RepID=UPI001557E19C|nr:SMI1/KNR4 family protein [Bacillus sp. WMMC1349]NPC91246.1 SMI1/KNR4 family protein [Bacillus sp. WMMC1349]